MVVSLLQLLLLLLVNSAPSLAANDSDVSALREFAARINLPGDFWDFNANPCSGKWRGICCSDPSGQFCCLDKKFNPEDTTCSSSMKDSATIVVVSLDSNYRADKRQLNGSIGEAICALTSLVQLDLNNNNLTGQIPSCIGDRLTELRILGLAGGNLNGSIPSQLGKLGKLRELYVDNNRLSGEIPPSFGSLRSLQQLYLRGNQLTGPIPESLGELRNLLDLELQVNRLNGSIPATFSSLNNITRLYLFGNQLSGELNLTVFQGMPNLQVLDLHVNSFTGPLPAFGQEFGKLTQLALGFNRFSGAIPPSFGALPAIADLYIGHNNLSGSIPSSFGTMKSIKALDVSHNSLTGSLQNLPLSASLDISFNAFDMSSIPRALLQQGQQKSYFNCISGANSSSCLRSPPGRLSNFGVATGGPLTNNDGTRFEADSGLNGTGFSYFGVDGNWALEVSAFSAGIYTPGAVSSRIQNVPAEDNPALYQSMRWSSSYMAYHGGSLENGEYIVTMYFAETVIPFRNVRLFDVLLQGKVVEKDLDVVSRVGAFRALKIIYNVNVTGGTLSIEFIFTGKDRYLDPPNRLGAMISAISVRSLNPAPGSKASWRTATLATVISFVVVVVLVGIACYKKKSRKNTAADDEITWPHGKSVGLKAYTYKELSDATCGFRDSEMLGQGAFGRVYLGLLDGSSVAVKQLLTRTQQSKQAFKKEMEILSSVQHRNLLSVIGYCVDAEFPMLVCDYMPNGSLDQLLYTGQLTWEERKSIAIGTALGLAYLHDESKDRIVHCDVKPPNILLDQELNPRIGDFGMARLYEEGKSHITATKMGGTVGYLAPEYAMHYQVSDKADVYSFGVVLLELISGRRAIDAGKQQQQQPVLVDWAQSLASLGTSELVRLLDPRLEEENVPSKEVTNAASIALLCIQETASARPGMRNVWLMLTGMVDIPPVQESMLKMDALKALIDCYAHTTTPSTSRDSLIAPAAIGGR